MPKSIPLSLTSLRNLFQRFAEQQFPVPTPAVIRVPVVWVQADQSRPVAVRLKQSWPHATREVG